MGYRSTVTAIFYPHKPEDYAAIKLWVQENILNLEIVKECADVTFHEDGMRKDTIEVSFQDIKWYDSYGGVQAFEDALGKFQDLFDTNDSLVEGAYEMAKIGEDLEDTEHRASDSAEYYLNIRREIEFY